MLANKQLRWWWNNTHQAIYDDGDGKGWAPHGPPTQWIAQSKSLAFIEYGLSACDKGSNQPNVFFDSKSVESATPYWSIWQPIPGGAALPQRDDTLAALALEAIYQYWNLDGRNLVTPGGLPMVQFAFSCVWSWDARPFPVFPILATQWGDTGNWQAGVGSMVGDPSLPPPGNSQSPAPGVYSIVSNACDTWLVDPRHAALHADIADHVSGRSTRRSRYASARYDLELTYDLLRSSAVDREMQAIAGFFAQMGGAATPFWLAPPGLSTITGQQLGIADGANTSFALLRSYGSFTEQVAGTSGVMAVYLNGVAATQRNWAVTSGFAPAIIFSSAPGVGVVSQRTSAFCGFAALPTTPSISRSSWRRSSSCAA